VLASEQVPALKLTVSYEGTAFQGSQRQSGGRTVQEELERSLSHLGFEPAATVFAGRTDRGVHAIGQIVRCDDGRPAWAQDKIMRALNAVLPDDISVLAVNRVATSFHPRYDAVWREYRYRIWCGAEHPLVRHRVWSRRAVLNLDAMVHAARLLVGTHDLAAFTGGGEGVPWSARASAPRGTVRTIFHCGVRKTGPWWGIGPGDGYGIELRIIADGFLPQLVRTIAGALVTIGMNRQPSTWITQLIGEADRRHGPVMAPPHGLVLWRIGYGDDLPEADGRQLTAMAQARLAEE